MQLFTLFIGLEKDGNGNPLDQLSAIDAIKAMKLEAAQLFGGYSISAVTGGWVNEKGLLIEEAAMRIEITASVTDGQIISFALRHAAALQQSSVLIAGPNGAGLHYVKTAAKAA